MAKYAITKPQRKVSGGKLPDEYEVKIDITIDYTNVSDEELMERAFASDLIVIQGQLRKKTTAELNALAKTGYKVDGNAVRKAAGGVSYKTLLMTMGLTEEQAVAILNDPVKFAAMADTLKTAFGEEPETPEAA